VRDVNEYFSGREDDILYLDICGGEGWESLCKFLGKEVPDIPFPSKNNKGSFKNLIFSDRLWNPFYKISGKK
jgi:hypothetical protein